MRGVGGRWSGSAVETAREFFDGVVLVAAEAQFAAVFHDDEVAAAEPGLDLLHEIDVDDGGAVDAEEPCGIELLFEALESLADFEGALACVEASVVAEGFDALDLGDGEEADAAVLRDGEARDEGWLGGTAELGEKELKGVGVDTAVDAFADAIEGFAEAVGGERLEEIVDGVDFKGLQRVLIVGRDEEDDGGRARGGRPATTWKPSSSGMRMSRKRRSGCWVFEARTADSPSPHSPRSSLSGGERWRRMRGRRASGSSSTSEGADHFYEVARWCRGNFDEGGYAARLDGAKLECGGVAVELLKTSADVAEAYTVAVR